MGWDKEEVDLLSLPIGASPDDFQYGETDWGAKIYRTQHGTEYFIEPRRVSNGSVTRALLEGVSNNPVGIIADVGSSVAQALIDTVSIPGRAASGESVSYGDILDLAGMAQLGAAGGSAPQGALRSGMSRDAADEVMELLKSGRGTNVTDDMMAAADQAYLSSIYDLPLDEVSRMARAQEMGFDTGRPMYHAARADVDGFDLGKADTGTGHSMGRIWAAGNPDALAPYELMGSDHSGLKLFSRADYKDISAGNARDVYASTGGGFPDVVTPVFGGRPIPVSGNGKVKLDRSVDVFRALENGEAALPVNRSTRGRASEYADDFAFRGVRDGGPAVGDIYATSNPTDLRSIFARFDPRLSHLRNLSAGVAGAAAVPFVLLGGSEDHN